MPDPAYDAVVFLFFLATLLYCMREGYDDYPRLWTAIGVTAAVLCVLLAANAVRTL